MCVALGAREAEQMLLDELSMGAVGDLQTATYIARELVEIHAMGGATVGLARFRPYGDGDDSRQRWPDLSEAQKEALDRAVQDILEEARQRAIKILRENRAALELLRDLLLEKKTLDAKTLRESLGSLGEDKKIKARDSKKKGENGKTDGLKNEGIKAAN